MIGCRVLKFVQKLLILFLRSVIIGDGYGEIGKDFNPETDSIHCVEFDKRNGFATDVYGDWDPLSRFKTIEVIAHCEDFREEYETGKLSGNIGAVIKKKYF